MKHVTVLLMCLLLLFLPGCLTWNRGDWIALGAAGAGQAADLASTKDFLDRGWEEGNPMLADDDDDRTIRNVAVAKIVSFVVIAAVMQIMPNHKNRQQVGYMGAAAGFGAAGWNVYSTRIREDDSGE
jgi:hypothetical protein